MKKVLIIGSNSYIGKSLQDYIHKNGFINSTVLITMISASNGEWKSEDLSQYDTILHLSGIVHQKEKEDMEVLYDKVNHRMPVAIAKKAKENNVKQFIFMSTAAVYGEKATCITKDTEPNPTTYYGRSKFAAEQDIRKLQTKEFGVTIVRPPMVYGQGCKGNYPRLVKLAGKTPIFPEFHNKRSMIHIDTLCSFLYELIIHDNCGCYFPQDEEYVDTSELVVKLRKEMGKRTLLIKSFNPIIRLLMKYSNSLNKIFGDCYYTEKVHTEEPMGRLKVLQVNKLYYPVTGGIERVVQQIAEGLNDKTKMNVLVCQEKGKSVIEEVNGVTVHRAGSLGTLFSMPISFSFFRRLKKLSKDRDVIHFHMPFPLGDLGCLLSGYKGKVVVWWHSDIVRQKKLMLYYHPIMKKFLARADIIIVATQGHIDGSDYLPEYSDKCVIIPYGVDKEIEAKGDNYIKNSSPKHKEIINILFVGRLVYYKGCKILLEAFCKVKGAELTMIGSGNLEEELKEQAKILGINDKVHFLGNASEEQLNQAFEECDVFVLPSIVKSEAFGLVQIEAMSYGKPVINTSLASGVPYVSLDHITGLTVTPNDVQALTEAMQWMVDHEEERIEMGKKARERVKECYQMDNMLQSVFEIYQS